MRFAFRVDATRQIGTGHFMRCLTLADELKKQGACVRFIGRDLPLHLAAMLTEKAIEYVALPSVSDHSSTDELAHSKWLGVSQAEDASATHDALEGLEWDWMVVDHYALDARWERILRASVKKIMVIDDLADRQHDCDVLLDQNYYAGMCSRYQGKVPAYCEQLLGPGYALLREEFRVLRARIKPRSGAVEKILVFFGGVDADNYTGMAIEALAKIKGAWKIDVVIGAQHPCRENVEAACIKHGYQCHVQTSRMAELVAQADLALGGGGTAIWERSCLGLPTIIFCTAENQRLQVIDAADFGLVYSPISGRNVVEVIQMHTNALSENPALLRLLSNNQMRVVDGKGTFRVSAVLMDRQIAIRRATSQDSMSLFAWRNHPKIRAVSRIKAAIAWDEHQRWFHSVLVDGNRELLIGWDNDKPVGVVRFDKEQDFAEVSIYLVPDGDYSGQGKNLLFSAESWLKTNHPDIKGVRAHVLAKNEASENLFLGSKYQKESVFYEKYF